MKIFIYAIFSYIIGSFPNGLIIGKIFFHKDIREYGSKNIGGTNAGRVLGKVPGLIVSVMDFFKVFIPAYIAAKHLVIGDAAIVGIFGMIGHCYSVFLGFKGGKGVSSYFGMVAALNIFAGAVVIIVWKILKHTLNYVSLASILSCFLGAFIFLYVYGFGNAFLVLLAGTFIVVYQHRTNISRLLNGTENKVNPQR